MKHLIDNFVTFFEILVEKQKEKEKIRYNV